MANPKRGEIDAVIGGETMTLCLTLGALAELEARLQAGDLNGLVERFAEGRISARDLTSILGAGLRGAGHAITDDDLARLAIEDGLKGAAEIAARLLRATFGGAEGGPS
ncbi:gene transfer agent family protein [Pelagibacterium montanilacus]|uniref:gene transfer agent family protein n=1 Tax=Pelagibacterium montanilacus TaxID=2185280 RepID=UPI000F8E7225|nr:gene transfer agent family protein [Pelagibacterium montanilacus]